MCRAARDRRARRSAGNFQKPNHRQQVTIARECQRGGWLLDWTA